MKRIIGLSLLMGIALLSALPGWAQTQASKQDRKISKQEQKEIAQQQANQQFEVARQALKEYVCGGGGSDYRAARPHRLCDPE